VSTTELEDIFNIILAGILRNTETIQTWLPPIKEEQENNMYGWLPSTNHLSDNV
jgi:hypothetical protein